MPGKKTAQEIMNSVDLDVACKELSKKRAKELARIRTMNVEDIITKMQERKNFFISENDFVINFCLQATSEVGESWIIEAETYKDKKRTDLILSQKPHYISKYFFEFKYQRSKMNITDGVTGQSQTLKAKKIKAGDICKDIFRMQELKKSNNKRDYKYFVIAVTQSSTGFTGFDESKIEESIENFNKKHPEKKIDSELGCARVTFDSPDFKRSTHLDLKKAKNLVYNPTMVSIFEIL